MSTADLIKRAEDWLARLRPSDMGANGPMYTRQLVDALKAAPSTTDARDAAFEEAAQECDAYVRACRDDEDSSAANDLAHAIRRRKGTFASSATDARDAARWRALFECSRIRVLGYARGGPQGRDGAIRHIGFEWTTDQAPYCDTELLDGKERLIEFTDAILGASTDGGAKT